MRPLKFTLDHPLLRTESGRLAQRLPSEVEDPLVVSLFRGVGIARPVARNTENDSELQEQERKLVAEGWLDPIKPSGSSLPTRHLHDG
jgi:hypothetical protein